MIARWRGAAVTGLALAAAVSFIASTPAWAGDVSDAEAVAIARRHCVPCHARAPAHPAFAQPPRDIVLETIEDLRLHADKISEQAIESRVMPLGNDTEMTDAERAALAQWIMGLK
jgi:uncharacterized membrane protein